MKKNDYLFLIIFAIILLVGFATIFRSPKEKSDLENRTLVKFPKVSFKNYLNGSFQDDIEGAFADQFIGSGTIKKYYNKIFDTSRFINKNKRTCENNYYNIGDRAIFDCSDYIVYYPAHDYEDFNNQYLNTINSYSKLNDYSDVYYYFINTSDVFDFKKNDYAINMKEIYKNNMSGNYKYDEFTFKNFKEFKDNFYKTDHHWNHKGSYRGYVEIMNMFGIKDVIKPVEKVTFKDLYYFGSHATFSRYYDIHEDFTVYRFNYPKYTSYLNGVKKNYGREDTYFNNEYDKDKHVGLYGGFYGGDNGEIIFDFHNNNKDNLLIIGNSFTNSINKLVASHFNKTYIIDLRHYEERMHKKFDAKSYIKKNNIDKVLVISDYSLYLTNEFELDWGNK